MLVFHPGEKLITEHTKTMSHITQQAISHQLIFAHKIN